MNVPNSQRWFASNGFTLLELLVVLVLLSLMVVIVPPSLSRPTTGELKMLTQQMASALRYTRSKAIAEKAEATFNLDVEERWYQYPGVSSGKKFSESLMVKFTAARKEFVDTTRGGIRFYPDGSSTGGEIAISQANRRQKITVSWITGKVKVHD